MRIVCHLLAPSASEPFAQTLRHRAQRFFARGDDRGQNHQSERKPARDERDIPAEENYEQSKTEEAENNRGHAGEIQDRDPDKPNPTAVVAILAQINRTANPDDQREHHRSDDEQRRADNAGPYAAGGIRDAVRFHFRPGMRNFPIAKLAIAQRQFFPFVIENIKRLRRLGQERDINEGRARRKNGATAFDSDVEKDVGGTRKDEVGRQAQYPKDDTLNPANAA